MYYILAEAYSEVKLVKGKRRRTDQKKRERQRGWLVWGPAKQCHLFATVLAITLCSYIYRVQVHCKLLVNSIIIIVTVY